MTRLFLLLSIPLLLSSSSRASAACKDGRLVCDGHANPPGAAVVAPDPTATLDCNTLHQTIHLEFDHVAGLAGTDAVSVTGHWPYAATIDDYTLTGLAAGTVVPITVVGDFDLQNIRKDTAVTWSGGWVGTPPIPGAPDPSYVETYFTASATGTETATRQVRLAVNMKAGEPFDIQLSAAVFASGGAGGFSHGRLSFEGLPPGTSITSCKGFRQDAPTPALAKSWGGLKATYR